MYLYCGDSVYRNGVRTKHPACKLWRSSKHDSVVGQQPIGLQSSDTWFTGCTVNLYITHPVTPVALVRDDLFSLPGYPRLVERSMCLWTVVTVPSTLDARPLPIGCHDKSLSAPESLLKPSPFCAGCQAGGTSDRKRRGFVATRVFWPTPALAWKAKRSQWITCWLSQPEH